MSPIRVTWKMAFAFLAVVALAVVCTWLEWDVSLPPTGAPQVP